MLFRICIYFKNTLQFYMAQQKRIRKYLSKECELMKCRNMFQYTYRLLGEEIFIIYVDPRLEKYKIPLSSLFQK